MLDKSKPPIIDIEKLEVTYNQDQSNEVKVLRSVDLKIYPNEYLIIFGPSGCGKSTLLYTIAGLQKPTKGKVRVDAKEIYAFEKMDMVKYHQFKIGMIFQAFYLIPSLNVINNVGLPQSATGGKTTERKKKSENLLNRFGILNQSQKFPFELSGGQKQRVSIARSLINDPAIILADEPVGNLDSVSSLNVMKILQELNEKDKKTIILITHDPSHLRYGDRVIHVKDGKIIKEEIIKNKITPDEEIEEKLVVTEEKISPELKMLMHAFKNLSLSQVGALLIPFKAQQLLSHVLLSITHEQLDRATSSIKNVFTSHYGQDEAFSELFESLDKDFESGGAGWDKREVRKFVSRARKIIKTARAIDLNQLAETTEMIYEYVSDVFGLKLSLEQESQTKKAFIDRLENITNAERLSKTLDTSIKKGGAGLDRRTAKKITREIEIIMLLHYGM